LNSMEMPALRHRTRGLRCVMHADAVRIRRITPQPHVNAAEGVYIRQCFRADHFGQDNKRLMSEKPITDSLAHGSTPIHKLEFKGSCRGSNHLNECLASGKCLARMGLPRHSQHVRDSVSVYRDFTRYSQAVVICLTVHLGCQAQIGPCKSNRESVFECCYAPASRQVSPRLRKPDFRDNDRDLSHRFSIGSRLTEKTRSDGESISFGTYTWEEWPMRVYIFSHSYMIVNRQNGSIKYNSSRYGGFICCHKRTAASGM